MMKSYKILSQVENRENCSLVPTRKELERLSYQVAGLKQTKGNTFHKAHT